MESKTKNNKLYKLKKILICEIISYITYKEYPTIMLVDQIFREAIQIHVKHEVY